MKFKKLFVLLLILVVLSTCLVSCKLDRTEDNKEYDELFAMDDLRVTPNSAIVSECKDGPQDTYDKFIVGDYQDVDHPIKIDSSLLVMTDGDEIVTTDEAKKSAAYLYNIANHNRQTTSYWVSYGAGSGYANIEIGGKLRGDMSVRDWQVKDGNEYYFEDFAKVTQAINTETNEDSSLGGPVSSMLEYCHSKYSPDGKTFYVKSGSNKCFTDNMIENYLIEDNVINWAKAGKVTTMSYQEYLDSISARRSHVEIDNSLMKWSSISGVKLSHNKDGYYELYIEVDVTSDCLLLGEENLRQSALSNDLKYVYQKITIQIWDCGLIRNYATLNSWSATIGSAAAGGVIKISGESTNTYSKAYSYNKENVKNLVITQEIKDMLMG